MPQYPFSKLNKMKYPSPSGLVNMGKYIPPFEKVENGFGYRGVILEDYESGKLQCHICGEWLEMFNSHLQKHDINSEEYKKRFGLSISTALRSKRLRLIQSKNMIELRKKYGKFNRRFQRDNLFAGNRKDKSKSAETKNKHGVCDLQIASKVLELARQLNKTPTLIDLKEAYGGAFIGHIHKRYDSYIKLCRKLELKPVHSNYNPKYSKKYFIEKGLSNEPSLRILTTNEGRALYRYFKSVKEWKKAVEKRKNAQNGKDKNNKQD